jgi:NAD(P)-dependent dehydrogenase (short-subunit alcohol dehydrogenase family)
MPDLTGKRVLILGAETEIGRAVTAAVAEAGAAVAAVAATSDAEAAFAVQRLARRLSSGERKVISQAIDATNEAGVRVMVRQVSKELGGLDAVVDCTLAIADPGQPTEQERLPSRFLLRHGSRELERGGGGRFVEVRAGFWDKLATIHEGDEPPSWQWDTVSVKDRPNEVVVPEVVRAIAGETDSG